MRILLSCALFLTLACVTTLAEDKPEDTVKAAKTRKLLLTKKISVDWKDSQLRDVVDELKEEVKGLFILVDTKGGVSLNRKVTFKAKDKPVEEILHEVLKSQGWGYIVISKKGNAYDGAVQIRVGKERGYEKKN